MYYVNLYQTTKCYGGPEEGGWYYEEGVYHSCEGAYSNKDEAWAKASSTLDTVNLVFGTTLDTDGAIAQEYNFVNGNSVVDPA